MSPPGESSNDSPIKSFILLERYNAVKLVKSVHGSLAALSKVIRGTQLLTKDVQNLAAALLTQEVKCQGSFCGEKLSISILSIRASSVYSVCLIKRSAELWAWILDLCCNNTEMAKQCSLPANAIICFYWYQTLQFLCLLLRVDYLLYLCLFLDATVMVE